jgi:Nucleotidyl transferase AbiEii toxin, Type IV TA system
MKPRNPKERLDRAIPRVARQFGIAETRVRTWVSFLAISGALQSALERGELAFYQLKGGAALELRFPGILRATQDFDVALPGTRTQRINALTQALSSAFDDFNFRVKPKILQFEQADTVRVEVAVTYQTRPFQTVEVDLGPSEAESEQIAPSLPIMEALSLRVPSPISCTRIDAQIAQKIHAATNPRVVNDLRQDRARDIIDILMLRRLGQFDPVAIRSACEVLFATRSEHKWIPVIPSYPTHWHATMSRLASEIDYPFYDADSLIAEFGETLQEVITSSA